jgi:polyisoprenyl-teichoic acid--peptidoglycan teichoic acid transferase
VGAWRGDLPAASSGDCVSDAPEGRTAAGPPDTRRRRRRFGPALALTVAGAVVPGVGFLAAGRRTLGAAVLVVFLLLVGGGVWLATAGRDTAIRWAVESSSLLWIAVTAGVVAAVWIVLVVAQHLVLRPRPARGWQTALGALLVLVLAAAVALPAYEVTRLASVQRSLLAGLFGTHRSATVDENVDAFTQDRVNVLLLGGDSGPGRDGVRTDTVVVASIDTHTGATTMFSLPRNLENLPFPAGSPLAAAYPKGFTAPREDEGLLNAVYRNGPMLHPGLLGATDNEGADWLKLGVGQALGLHLDYYVLVNMEGFSRLVDDLGGITVNVNYWVPINGIPDSNVLPDDYIAPGANQHLDGYLALQYARGRYGLNDYLRMQRQRCVLNAVLQSADPVTVLKDYQQLADTTQGIVRTDIPEKVLDDFVSVALEAKKAPIRSVVFDSSVINPAYPDYPKIRGIVSSALADPGTPSAAAQTSSAPTATPSPSAGAPAPESGAVADVTDACAYDPAQAGAALAAGKPPTRKG